LPLNFLLKTNDRSFHIFKYIILPSISLSLIAIVSTNQSLWVTSPRDHFYFELFETILAGILVTMPTLVIPEGGLAFKLPNNRSIITEFLDYILIHNPIITNREDEKKVALIPSILGLDFLNRYRLTIQNSYIILEK
jgi:hypothetical protein